MRLSLLALVAALAAPLATAQSAAQRLPDLSSAAAPDSGPLTVTAQPVEAGAVHLDGKLDEAAWAAAAPVTAFVQMRPSPGDAASEATEARVLYDAHALYVGMHLADSQPERIDARLGRRDTDLETDWAIVAIDSYHDRRTAFLFQVNPAGVKSDALFYDDNNQDDSWDAVWDVATHRDSTGWTAEFRIPLSQLRFASGEGAQVWGIEFGRQHFRTGEQSFWAPILPDVDGVVSRFGTLHGLRDLQAPRRIEVQPYVAAAVTRAPGEAANPYYHATDAAPRVGLDLKYGLTSDLTLTATANPDFGQVEADPAQVNLGGFELFFDERRPFFIEGTDVFSLEPRRMFSSGRPTLLYTRRIGRSPQRGRYVPSEVRDAAGEAGEVYTDAPQQTTILGAAKLSGRVGRFSVGILDAVTAPEYGVYAAFDADGQAVGDGRALVEPASNYLVGRTRATFGRTILGGALTAVNRASGDPVLSDLLPTQAYVAAVDAEHRLADGWILNGQLAGSRVMGSAAAITSLQRAFPRLYQRPDADYLGVDPDATALGGLTGEVNVLRTGGSRWVGALHTQFTTPGFDANSLGYQSRADAAGVGGVVVYQNNDGGGPFQRYSANLFGGSEWNFGGDRTDLFVGGNVNLRLKSFWGSHMNWHVATRAADDRLTRGGPLATSPARLSISGNVYSDDRKPIAGFLWAGTRQDELGGGSYDAQAGVDLRPAAGVRLSVGPEVSVGRTARQYLGAFDAPEMAATFGRRYVFGELESTSLSLETRLDWTFSSTLSLQLYARPFVARGRYVGFSQLGAPGQLRFPTFGEDVGEVARTADGEVTITPGDGSDPISLQPDFTVRALQGNAVLRWEYRPGSTLFLVWQQQRNGFEPDGHLRTGRDFRGVFTDAPTNVFLLKLSYWLG